MSARKSAKKAEWTGWYFADASETLRYGDGRKIIVGKSHTVKGEPILCGHGLHASKTALEALQYAPGPILYRVKLSGKRVDGDDKSCATKRTYIARVDAEPILREFARKCALKVIHLWDAPRVVKDYLETGDESLREAASAAAWAASAARAASAAAWAAWAASAARAASAAAWAARAAAWAASAAAQKEQSNLLEQMCLAAIKKQGKHK